MSAVGAHFKIAVRRATESPAHTRVSVSGLALGTVLLILSRSALSGRLPLEGRTAEIAAGVSLTLGAVALMNYLLMAASENEKEAAAHRDCGATPSDIVARYLIEAWLTGAVGWVCGWTVSVMVLWGHHTFEGRWSPVVPVRAAIAAACAVGIVSLLAGLYPALKAASRGGRP